jgi:S1-C subfamily serine protease
MKPLNRTLSPVTVTGAAALLLLAGSPFAAEPAPAQGEDSRQETERALEEAQQRLDSAVREVERLSGQLGARLGDRFMRGPMTPPRALLGVQVRTVDGTPGAHVMAVSPGGAAQGAGLREGDVITVIGDTDLTRAADPGRALAEAMQSRDPDLKVKVRYTRDGKSQEIEVAPRAAPRVMALRGAPANGVRFGAGGPGGPGALLPPGVMDFEASRYADGRWERAAPLAGMELATLSERLGGYFGTKQGVLVVRAGNSDAYKLQDGDVILSVDGREPNNASHATRILRSYQRGEKLQLKVMRERRTVTLDVTLPGG